MPDLALTLLGVCFFALFVLRSLIQLATTGSTGLKGFHGRIGSLPWIAGMAIVVGLLLAPLAPLAALRAWPGGRLSFAIETAHLLGAALVVLGLVGTLGAQLAMGRSWRVGVDESERTELVTRGPFGWVRNPIYTCMAVSLLGFLLLVPNALAAAAVLVIAAGIELQVRAVEEPYLLRVHQADYRAYAARVGRFLPGIGRLRDGDAERSSA